MNRWTLCVTIILAFKGLAAEGADPTVTNVRAAQRSGTPNVDITYDLAGGDRNLTVSVAVSTNSGVVFFIPSAGLSGDVGRGITEGSDKKVVWNAGVALPPDLYSNVRVKVTANDAPEGMVRIPGGTNSGTDPDFGTYSLTVETFFMDATEVTKAKWDQVYIWAVAHGYTFDNAGCGKAANHPVHTVNWYDCIKWCNARSEMEGRTPCYTVDGGIYKTSSYEMVEPVKVACNFSADGYRLPIVTEWEYAARGGASCWGFPWGNTISHSQANYYSDWVFDNFGWHPSSEFDISRTRGYHPTFAKGEIPYTSPVGSFAANGYGLYDMVGNIMEWCYVSEDSGFSLDVHAITRGGCWSSDSSGLRFVTGVQHSGPRPFEEISIGFRAVCR